MADRKIGINLTRHIYEKQMEHPEATGELTGILNQIAFAAKIVSREVNKAGLVEILGLTGDENVQGEEVQKLDEFANEFDLLAAEFGPTDIEVSSLQYRRAALLIRKRSKAARTTAAEKFSQWMRRNRELPCVSIDSLDQLEKPGVFVLKAGDVGFYAGESRNMRARVEQAMSNESWHGLEPDTVAFVENEGSLAAKYALKSALAHRECPLLNCRLLVHESELPSRSLQS